MFKYKVLSLLFLCVFFLGCKKNGAGGKASISGVVGYNGSPVVPCTVYIKYGATTSPGTNPVDYDNQVNVDGTGAFTIASLYPGDYFLYAIGKYTLPQTSTQGGGYETVSGTTQANIPHTKSTVTYNISTTK